MSADGLPIAEDLAAEGAADRARLDDAYRTHWDGLCRYIRSKFGAGPPEPEDIAQAAFVKLATLSRPSEISNTEAFLKTAARNLALDAYRHGGRTRSVLREVGFRTTDDHDLTPEDVLESKDELRRLGGAIQRLSPKQRVALLMHRVDELSYAEIGRCLGMSPSGATKLIEKAFELCMADLRAVKR